MQYCCFAVLPKFYECSPKFWQRIEVLYIGIVLCTNIGHRSQSHIVKINLQWLTLLVFQQTLLKLISTCLLSNKVAVLLEWRPENLVMLCRLKVLSLLADLRQCLLSWARPYAVSHYEFNCRFTEHSLLISQRFHMISTRETLFSTLWWCLIIATLTITYCTWWTYMTLISWFSCFNFAH